MTVWNYLAWTAGQVAGIVLVITTFTDLNGTAAVIVAIYHYCSLHAAGRFPGGSVYRFPAGSPLSCGPGPCYPCGTAASLRRARGPGSNHFYRRILQAFWQCARRNYDYLVAPAPAGFIDNMALQRVFAAKDEKSAKGNITCRFPADDYLWPDPYVHRYYGQIYFACRLRSCQRYAQSFPAGPAQGDAGFAGGRLCRGGCFHRQFYLLVCSSTLEQDVYSVLRNTGKEKPASSLLVNRLFVVLVGLIALVLALKVPVSPRS